MTSLSEIIARRAISHFRESEVTMGRKIPFGHVSNIEETLVFADRMRAKLGFPIVITSSWRDTRLNSLVGGVKNSLHLVFSALDLVPMSGKKEELIEMHKYTLENRTRLMGVGFYPTFLHIDTRGRLNRYSPVTWGVPLV